MQYANYDQYPLILLSSSLMGRIEQTNKTFVIVWIVGAASTSNYLKMFGISLII